MANYLVTADVGNWVIRSGRTPDGIPETVAVDPTLPPDGSPSAVDFFYDTTAEATDLWSQTFGPYPFDSTGAIADNANYNGQAIGFSLETQTRPLYSAVRSDSTIAHELAHQWFGDSVSVQDVAPTSGSTRASRPSRSTCGTSTRASPERPRGLPARLRRARPTALLADQGGRSAARHDVRQRRLPPRRHDAPGAAREDRRRAVLPHPAQLDGRARPRQRARPSSSSTSRERISGQDLSAFFQTWLYTTTKPTTW